MILQLTWDGLDLAIDMIAAQCRKSDRSGVYAQTNADKMLAIPIADRLCLELLSEPEPSMVQVHAVFTKPEALPDVEDADHWAWVDMSPDASCNSVVKYQGAVDVVIMPWQQFPGSCSQPFINGFHD